eukprot:GHVU01116454.1.p1 GENE.GHVU01116454.1~~GHVU01116454.1.p1  ORF type:complete len:160 (-),score=29.08 GHVU01116454.1:31-510(-)
MPRTRAKGRPKAKAKAKAKAAPLPTRISPRKRGDLTIIPPIPILEEGSDSGKSLTEADYQQKIEKQRRLIEELTKQTLVVTGEGSHQEEEKKDGSFQTPLGHRFTGSTLGQDQNQLTSLTGVPTETRHITIARMEKYEFTNFDNAEEGIAATDWLHTTM